MAPLQPTDRRDWVAPPSLAPNAVALVVGTCPGAEGNGVVPAGPARDDRTSLSCLTGVASGRDVGVRSLLNKGSCPQRRGLHRLRPYALAITGLTVMGMALDVV
jgi:hypothetical protein